MKSTMSREALVSSSDSVSIAELKQNPEYVMGPPIESILKNDEKLFLLYVERGDVASVKRLLVQYKDRPHDFNPNCTDPLGRSALVIAIENESYELLQVLLQHGVEVRDALLHAISEEYVEAVETLLEWEEHNHRPGDQYSWEAIDKENATFTPDITPLILAAHKNSYEILKLLLDRGASLPMPHDVKCGCDECVAATKEDSLRHSRSRINAYRALASPSLIALSSKDPVLTAFELSTELRRLATVESEFSAEYQQLQKQCEEFSRSLVEHARTSYELEVMLNHSTNPEDFWDSKDSKDGHSLERLKLAIKYDQKSFVAHANVQQLLGAIWYEGLPGFRRRSILGQLLDIFHIAAQFPLYSLFYMMAPTSQKGSFMKKPFVKFICHSASYVFFLFLLGLASQRVEYLVIEWFGPDWMKDILHEWMRKERGSLPGPVESAIMFYVLGFIWAEIKSLWSGGLLEYLSDLWNIVDFITNTLFIAWISLRAAAWYIVQREQWDGHNPWYPREEWNPYDPMLLSEGMFGAAMIFSFLKMVHVFSVSPHLGPLQISLGRMVIDIIKFFFIYMLVLFAFGCGMNQLLWYYAALEKDKCYSLPGGLPDLEKEAESCFFWRRFANLFETSQSLFWASFGLVDLQSFELTGIKSFTRFWGLLMFGSYSVINIIVLLNMLIAMMSNSYQIISERSDTEWKFARTKLWISYFDDGATVPVPFNLFPNMKTFMKIFNCKRKANGSLKRQSMQKAELRHMEVMRMLVRRYVTAEQKKSEEMGVTEDDVNEIKQDISTFRYELVEILRQNGMDTSSAHLPSEQQAAGKKGRVRERRLKKGFQIGMVEDVINEVLSSEKGPKDVFGKIAKAIAARSSSKSRKTDWNAVAARKASVRRDPIGSSQTSARRWSQQSLRRSVMENERDRILSLSPNELVEYNPRLKEYTPVTRLAYAKFKSKTLGAVRELKETPNEPEKEPKNKKAGTERSSVKTKASRASSTAIDMKQADPNPVPVPVPVTVPGPAVVTVPEPKVTVPEPEPKPETVTAKPSAFEAFGQVTDTKPGGTEEKPKQKPEPEPEPKETISVPRPVSKSQVSPQPQRPPSRQPKGGWI